VVGTCFVAGGAVSWWLRPRVRVGPLLVTVGVLWLVAKVPPEGILPAGFETVRVGAWVAVLARLVVAFPTGRLETVAQRSVVGLTYLSVATLAVLESVGLRSNEVTDGATVAVVTLCGVAILVLQVVTWRQSPIARRRHLAPMVAVVAAAVLAVVVLKPARIAGHDTSGLVALLPLVLATVPLGYLGGLLRHRLDRGRVADLLVKLHGRPEPTSIETALRRTLHDPQLRVGYRMVGTDRYVDVDGRDLPASDGLDTVSTRVDRGPHPLAVLVHDRALLDEPALIRAATAAVGLALDNERLTADLRARLAQLAVARDRVVSATEAERRRIERDLHDGVQQRLLSILMTLGLAGAVLRNGPERVGPLLAEARAGTQAVLDDLRALVHGIHPPVLTERGLAGAVKELVALSPTPVDARIDVPPGVLRPEAESAAYYVVAEGLTNVSRHACADRVRMVVGVEQDALRIEITDDGRGGADPSAGTGLNGLRQRVEHGGGTIRVDSPPSGGTRLVAVLPCAL
jgi:signal transduction histidine kinase